MTAARSPTVALVGNPNTGKTTLFNALAGMKQHVGNYPGVTVETVKGKFRHKELTFEVIDLPGTYSLAPALPRMKWWPSRSFSASNPAESASGCRGHDCGCLRIWSRNLYLMTQVMELGDPSNRRSQI